VQQASIESEASSGNLPFEMPPQELVEKMTFSEQLELALRVSQSADKNSDAGTTPSPKAKAGITPTSALQTGAAEVAKDPGNDVLLRLKMCRAREHEEPLEVVLKDFTVGETLSIPEQLRRPLEQVSLRLTKNNWLLFYEGIAAEAQLRARAVAAQVRDRWCRPQSLLTSPDVQDTEEVRSNFALEARLLQLPIFNSKTGARTAAVSDLSADLKSQNSEDEQYLRMFLEAWQEHETWAVSLEEHLGPLDLEIGRERSNNLQRGKAHTPYSAELCRLAFRNFAICEARMFFRLALAIYDLILQLCEDRASDVGWELLEAYCEMGEEYAVPDDALAKQRNTLQEYRYYFLEPLQRARKRFFPDAENNGDCVEDDLQCVVEKTRTCREWC
jgi:hypothetical protein